MRSVLMWEMLATLSKSLTKLVWFAERGSPPVRMSRRSVVAYVTVNGRSVKVAVRSLGRWTFTNDIWLIVYLFNHILNSQIYRLALTTGKIDPSGFVTFSKHECQTT
jgi:hypothetical protein